MQTASPNGKASLFKKAWFQILIWGLILFFVTERVMIGTRNPNFIPTVIMLGSFLIPVVFVTYIYEKGSSKSISLPTIALSFLIGGVLGIIGASMLEYQLRIELGVLPFFWVGVAEEAAKLIFPLAVYFKMRHHSEFDGIAFGVASGMGFAALETMGYGLMSLVGSQGDISSLLDTLVIRGLFSPAGHAAWTGFVCSIIWSEREKAGGRNTLNWKVAGAFLAAVLLHALWDTFQQFGYATLGQFLATQVLSATVALTSLGLLIYRIHHATRSGEKGVPKETFDSDATPPSPDGDVT